MSSIDIPLRKGPSGPKAGPGPMDHKVLVNGTDQTPGFLADKLVQGPGIQLDVLNPGGNEQIKVSATPLPQSLIVWAPGIANPAPPVYQNWTDIEAIVAELQGAVRLMVDMTGLSGFAQVPATANLDGLGRMEIVGAGPRGEVQLEMGDGGVIKNVREWRTVVVRATPTVTPPIVYDIPGLVVEGFDATFQFGANTATKPVIQIAPPGPGYISLLFNMSSQLRNNHNPGKAVLDISPGCTLLMAVAANVFGVSFVDTVSGPVGTTFQLEVDSTLVPPTFAAFLGALSITQDSSAAGTTYSAAVPANWSGSSPATVQAALDRIAAAIGPIP